MNWLREFSPGGRVLVALAVAGATFAIASVVQASIPDASGVIHGCYTKSGALSVIDASLTTCKSSETALDWNKRGVTGATGATGPTGVTGPAGISDRQIVRASASDPPNTTVEAQAQCPSGEVVLGGAGGVQGVPTGVWLHTQVTEFPGFSSYDVIGVNTTSTTQQINSTAICARVN